MINNKNLVDVSELWDEIKEYLLNVRCNSGFNENYIHRQIRILSVYFSYFILEYLSDEQKDEIINYLLKIKEDFLNKEVNTISNSAYTDLKEIIDNMKGYLNEIGGKIPNLALVERYEKILGKYNDKFREQLKYFDNKGAELFGTLTTHSIKQPFIEQSKKFSKKVKIQTGIFYALLFILFIWILIIVKAIHLPCLIDNDFLCSIFTITFDNTLEMAILRITSTIPIIWAILFLAKQIAQNKKIEQTYLHKSIIAQSYLNYLDFIEKHYLTSNNSSREIINSLHKVSIDGLGLNPALLLDKSTAEKIPMEEFLSKLVDKSLSPNKSKEQ